MISFLSKIFLELKIAYAKISGTKHQQEIFVVYDDFSIDTRDRVIVYSSYYNENCPEYIIALLRALIVNEWKIVLVLTGSYKGLEELQSNSKKSLAIIQRSNVGLDFGSFFTGLEYLEKFNRESFSLLLMNDSIIPLYPIKFVNFISQYSEKIKLKEISSLTDSYQYTYHLQSFYLFVQYSKDFLILFRKFMANFIFLEPKYKNYFIDQGEIRFSKFFRTNGYNLKPFFRTEKINPIGGGISLENINPTHDFWNAFIYTDCAFIKKDIFKDSSYKKIFLDICKDQVLISNPFLKDFINANKN